MQRSHLDMILNSNATREEDRFNAIFLSWNKYKHHIKNKNTVSEWNVINMTSARLKLYEIMDLWYKAPLLDLCNHIDFDKTILPSFASYREPDFLGLSEKNNTNVTFKEYIYNLLHHIKNKEEKNRFSQLINKYKMNSKPLWTENSTSIQLANHHCLSVKSNAYFIMELDERAIENALSRFSFLGEYNDYFHYVYIPSFIFTIPDYIGIPPSTPLVSSGTHLIGNSDKNRWIIHSEVGTSFRSYRFCSNGYTFNIY